MPLHDRDAASQLRKDQATAESIGRRDESLANLHRTTEAYDRAWQSRKRADELLAQEPPFDPEGTRPPAFS